MKHPATYTDIFIPKFAELLVGYDNVLDIFAGTGKIARIKDHGFKGRIICNEIEKEWADSCIYDVDEWHIGDASNMQWAMDNSFDAICTSPTFGNRMADHHNAKDNSKRFTYKHFIGRDLDVENTGRMQWSEKYRTKHVSIYKECCRVLNNNSLMILNISNHIRKGVVIDVVNWHKDTLIDLGMTLIDDIKIETPRMRFGRNSQLRVIHEHILVFKYNK